ncbi:hypothetical protein PC129_g6046 [Phytophthora cactorum]|uniref:Uncharacterized protein n=1 Tax=Phytophthora cactorum TaxID=29920 RepID=A0A8T1CS88_9STRA|nr:hypothetical protein PC112_g8301 [Phytophthora cactorum]KAG2831686.1 hypothetical protein PC111_g6888 [Phytophthora cactorum]KAG2859820.1 hypothetical protein PC113_g8613 [Phytophthora cactorum]KAG2927242.1 hypothetical protein PC115_g7643 [Phytophthora cactorum]KAG2945394.1 hypothetical protein PC117_g8509 [Phytophthora cactorum]
MIGSANMSVNAFEKNIEDIVFFRSLEAAEYTQIFLRRWNKAESFTQNNEDFSVLLQCSSEAPTQLRRATWNSRRTCGKPSS